MKKKLIPSLLVLGTLILTGCNVSNNGATKAHIDELENGEIEVMSESRKEFESYINNLETFPSSFIYGDVGYRGFPSHQFKLLNKTLSSDGIREHYIFVFAMRDGLQVTLDTSYYQGYDAFDWTIYFENKNDDNSKILRNVNAMDYDLKGSNPLIRGVLGDHDNQYGEYNRNLVNDDFVDENVIGRSTHITFPYYDLENDDGGAMIAIGWPGTYRAKFSYDERKNTTNVIGQGCLDFASYLMPGEKVMTPLIGIVRYYEKNEYTAINAWRRWYVDCNAPKKDREGNAFEPIQGVIFKRDIMEDPHTNDAHSETSETWKRSYQKVVDENLKFDFRLIDAGWYARPDGGSTTTDWWGFVGTWDLDKAKWPDNSFKETVDYGWDHNAFTQLWFESERVTNLEDLVRNYGFRKEWAISEHGNNNLNFINLANEDAYQWLKNRILTTINEYKIGLYREDFNAEPATSWEQHDAFIGKDRKGITENLYTQNHFRLWEEVINATYANGGCNYVDNCASGGGRNDLLSLRYSFPFNRSDADWAMVYPHSIPLRLAFSHATFKWLPLAGVYVNEMSDGKCGMYNLRASYAPIMTYACQFSYNKKLDWDNLHRAQEEWARVNSYLCKDYYPLTEYHKVSDAKTWDVFQFMDPQTGEGIIEAFRKESSLDRTVTVQVQALSDNKYYEIEDVDGNNSLKIVRGSALRKGFTIILDEPASSCLMFIKEIKNYRFN